MARRLEEAGVAWVICAFVSPSEEVRLSLPFDLLVFAACPTNVCIERDVKGMWAKAKRGEIENFTGWSAAYDMPLDADVMVRTDRQSVDECVDVIAEAIRQR